MLFEIIFRFEHGSLSTICSLPFIPHKGMGIVADEGWLGVDLGEVLVVKKTIYNMHGNTIICYVEREST